MFVQNVKRIFGGITNVAKRSARTRKRLVIFTSLDKRFNAKYMETDKMKRCNQCRKLTLKKQDMIKSPDGVEYICKNLACPDYGWSVFIK